jgi:hypothetical protein
VVSASDHDLFSWMDDADCASLNGSSDFRSAVLVSLVREGDGIVGEVVRVERDEIGFRNQWIPDGSGRAKVIVRVRAGRVDGVEIPSGTWVAIFWTPADLRRAWEQVGGLQVGDDLRLGYLGLEEWRHGLRRHSFACSVEREGATW